MANLLSIRRSHWLTLGVYLLLSPSLAARANVRPVDPVSLAVSAEVGTIARYTTSVAIDFAYNSEKVKIETTQVSKTTIAAVNDDGSIVIESETESDETRMNGEVMPGDTPNPPSKVTLSREGVLLDFASGEDAQEARALAYRIARGQAATFSAEEVSVGDTWTHNYSAVGDVPASEAVFKLLALEEAEGVPCAKIESAFREIGVPKPMTGQLTMWVELASGDTVKADFQFKGVPLPGPDGAELSAVAVGSSKRTQGGWKAVEGVEGAPDEAAPKTIEDVVKGYEKLPGLITMYKKHADATLKIYAEIPKGLMGEDLLLQATAASGNSSQLVTGTPITDLFFRFEERQTDKLTMVVPNTRFRARPGSDVLRAVERSFAEAFVEQFAIEARGKDGESVLIDLSDFFRGDIAKVESLFRSGGAGLFGGGGFSLDRDKTYVQSVKSFPENVVVQSVYSFSGSSFGGPMSAFMSSVNADDRNIVARIVYNISALPDMEGYVPRLSDPRIGYFGVTFTDYDDDRALDNRNTYILRWRLEKSDPTLAISEPKKPITFWIDNGMPNEYRPYVREALLSWNTAFLAAGFKDAVKVEQMPDDAEWDPADMRYNVVRWVTSPSEAYAVAHFRNDPRTGEILNASILVDANIVRLLGGEYTRVVRPASTAPKTTQHRDCRCVQDGWLSASVGAIAVRHFAEPGSSTEREYIHQFVRWVVTHEMGHILGLRHNFAASTDLDLVQLGQKETVADRKTSASVMDYIPFNLAAIGKDGVPFYGEGPGPYDLWAISYGYLPFGGKTPKSQRSDLAAIARRGNERGLAYQSDEGADNFDPYVTRFDLSAEPLDYWKGIFNLSGRMIRGLADRVPATGESYSALTRDFRTLIGMQSKASTELTRFVGGLRRQANFKGDPGERPTLAPIPAATQRRALELLVANVFSTDAFKFPNSLYIQFASSPNDGLMESMANGMNPNPVLDEIAGISSGALRSLMSPDTLSRVANNEFKLRAQDDRLTMASLFATVTNALWVEANTGAEVSALRRELQRAHLDLLIDYVLRPPTSLPRDARMLAWSQLKSLGKTVSRASGIAQGEYAPAHYEETLMRISRALNAVETLGSGGSSGPTLADLLGG